MLTDFRAISYTKKCVAKTFCENYPEKNAIFRVPHICIVVNYVSSQAMTRAMTTGQLPATSLFQTRHTKIHICNMRHDG